MKQTTIETHNLSTHYDGKTYELWLGGSPVMQFDLDTMEEDITLYCDFNEGRPVVEPAGDGIEALCALLDWQTLCRLLRRYPLYRSANGEKEFFYYNPVDHIG